MTTPICKGDWALNNACGSCSRCMATAPNYIRSLQNDLEMYRNAWLRELGGMVFRKAHLIDALVLTTRHMKRQADRFELEFLHSMDPQRYGDLSGAWFEVDQGTPKGNAK